MSALPNSSRRVIAGNTAQKPSQYRHALQMVITRSTSASLTLAGSGMRHRLRRARGLRAGDAAERRADAHADTGGISLAEDVARHHLACDEQVRAGPIGEPHRGRRVDLQ